MRKILSGSVALACLFAIGSSGEAAPGKRTIGFVAWDFIYASYGGGRESCPDGFNRGADELYLADQKPEERERLSKGDGARELGRLVGVRGELNACKNPTEFKNYGLKTYQGAVHNGLNLDGADTTTSANAPPNACAHPNFVSPTGEKGIDNQMGRAVGCIRGYAPGLDFDKTTAGTLSDGSYSVLIEVRGVDDLRNDPEVEVGIYSGTGGVATDPTGKLLPYQSVSIHDDVHYHNETKGKIVDGVLTTDPVHMHLRIDQQVIHSEYDFKDARLRMELAPDGSVLKGILGGYFDIARRWEHFVHAGVITSRLVAYNCPGVFAAIQAMADGYPDPKTGKCTAISTAMRVQAIPAFVIHPNGSKVAEKPAATTASR
ncbi:MAG: hypothetical protein EXQ84_07765 [Rhodospirillaceae bacterium]|nr:hypothetical protein [Rhodospirillaceae bacterium]